MISFFINLLPKDTNYPKIVKYRDLIRSTPQRFCEIVKRGRAAPTWVEGMLVLITRRFLLVMTGHLPHRRLWRG